MKTTLRRRCPYCQEELEVANYSVREIQGYHNPLTNKNTAIVEKLSCGHEYIDGKFNVDNIYFTNPINKTAEILQKTVESIPKEINVNVNHQYVPIRQGNGGLRIMDMMCLICLVALSFMCPPLVIIPILYFIGRMR